MLYRIEYSPEVEDHLRALTARQIVMVLDAIDEQLQFQPLVETRNRKPITLSTHPQFIALIERSRARQRTEGGISGNEMRQRLGAHKKIRAK